MFKNFSLYLFALAFHATLFSNNLPNREMIILLETNDCETIDKTLEAPNIYRYAEIMHPVGVGAISISLLVALYQEAAPIIANKSLIKNMVDHQTLFTDFANLNRKTLFEKYSKYNRFRGRLTLDNFKANCRLTNNLTQEVNKMISNLTEQGTYNFDQILKTIANHPKFQGESYPEVRNAMENSSYINSVHLEMQILLLCCSMDLDKNWDIKQVNNDIFLLIPKNYINKMGISVNQPILEAHDQTPKFTDLELELGLKIDHMKTVKSHFFNQPSIGSDTRNISFTKSLEQIFLTAQDIKKDDSRKTFKHIWSIHMSGHGEPQDIQLSILPQLYKLKTLYKSKVVSGKALHTGKHFSEHIKNQNQIYNYNQKELNTIKKLDYEIKKIEERKKLNNKLDQAMINSLSIHEFRDILKFFNTDIETAFLYYFSCFSAGPHLMEPYEEKGKSLILNYTVITGTVAENESLQEIPFINIPPYFTEKNESIFQPFHILDVDIKNKKLCMTTTLRFDNFFKLLRESVHNDPKKFILLPYSLHPHIDEFGKIISRRVANIPLVRYPKTDHFQPISYDNSSVILDTKNSTEPIIIDKLTGLIYSDYIIGKITLNKIGKDKEIPKLVSMVPGFALHVFEEICSTTLNLNEIVNSFLTFPELGSSKIFWIKKLECSQKNDLNKQGITYKDIIILRNIFNSNTLDLCTDQDPLTLENCAYFSTTNNKESKLTWKGPFIDDYNSKIVPCSQISHKEECLHCFPQVKGFSNPVLQSI